MLTKIDFFRKKNLLFRSQSQKNSKSHSNPIPNPIKLKKIKKKSIHQIKSRTHCVSLADSTDSFIQKKKEKKKRAICKCLKRNNSIVGWVPCDRLFGGFLGPVPSLFPSSIHSFDSFIQTVSHSFSCDSTSTSNPSPTPQASYERFFFCILHFFYSIIFDFSYFFFQYFVWFFNIICLSLILMMNLLILKIFLYFCNDFLL